MGKRIPKKRRPPEKAACFDFSALQRRTPGPPLQRGEAHQNRVCSMILIMRGVFHTGPEESSKGWPKGFEPGIVCSSVLRMKGLRGSSAGMGGAGPAGWWPRAGSNRRHLNFQSSALPTELPGHRSARSIACRGRIHSRPAFPGLAQALSRDQAQRRQVHERGPDHHV